MNRRSLAGLILFAVITTASLLAGAFYLSGTSVGYSEPIAEITQNDEDTVGRSTVKDKLAVKGNSKVDDITSGKNISNTNKEASDVDNSESEQSLTDNYVDIVTEEPWLSANPTDKGSYLVGGYDDSQPDLTGETSGANTDSESDIVNTDSESETTANVGVAAPELIYDFTKVDYMSYIPDMIIDDELSLALDIVNPDINVDAKAAVLIDADTKEILYYKNPVTVMFPASTSKLLTSLVALAWCSEDEQVTIGDEIKMIAYDSTTAGLRVGQILTVHNLLEGMLLPSGNDAAYAIAAYVGRKSLDNPNASKEEAIAEFVRLMNKEAKNLGAKNSCFKTPDGYDAIGQYTTAYDMALIGVAAANNSTIVSISSKTKSRNTYVSGEKITWNNTNKLINRDYGELYYSNAIGLKTGTTSLAGKNIVAAGRSNGKTVVCVVMDSTTEGRWKDAIKLLKYGLK
mgnify:CR=1 FL=1